MNISLEDYKKAVESCASSKTNYMFHNEGAEHAKIILSNIFMNAHDSVRMASNRLINKEIVGSEEYRKALLTFLNRPDTHLYIMLAHVPSKEQVTGVDSLFSMLYYHPAYKEQRIVIKDGLGKSFIDKKGDQVNFCTGDDSMYRIETDITKWTAVANFNDPDRSGALSQIFDHVFGKLKEFKLNDYFEQE